MMKSYHVKNWKIIEPNEWLNPENANDTYTRPVECLEHLLRTQFKEGMIRIFELGPFSALEHNTWHRAPIRLLQERNPGLICKGMGPRYANNSEVMQQTMGNVEHVELILDLNDSIRKHYSEWLEQLGGKADIIYAQHVFENSSSSPRSLPVGPYKPFEEAVTHFLSPNGWIVIDNYPGTLSQVATYRPGIPEKERDVGMRFEYKHSKGSIFVFQKGRIQTQAP